ncbi:MAG: bifunctional DNA-formamidopyrimidine glycosylase/DNA-(apurinic or apyrimidinic site) lyase [Planctomycetota bacterium]|nr:MAG: bifunctional DNA-formamidopyrimidine glycosylase/DNA-(apurinic or apyrimidinic site) lyase [Planctomycetota bacterium]
MPELPEVETMRRGVSPVAGARIRSICFPRRPRLRPLSVEPSRAAFRRRASGRTIRAVERAGKRVVLVLEGDLRIVFEPRMTGLVLLGEPPSEEHVRARLRLDGGPVPELLFWDRRGLGVLAAWSMEEFSDRLGPARLGPDALALGRGGLRARLGASRRAIKVALLDQRAVAGVGNIYAAESLHRARIHPARSCRELSAREWTRLQRALEDVLREAIRYEGSTLSDGTYRNALNQDGGYQNQFRVYDRAGRPCPRCGDAAVVERIVQAQRATFFCPRCQR